MSIKAMPLITGHSVGYVVQMPRSGALKTQKPRLKRGLPLSFSRPTDSLCCRAVAGLLLWSR